MSGSLRIVSHNAADSAVLVASNTAPGLGVEWLRTDVRAEVMRVLSHEVTIVATWPAAQAVGCVAIPAWNGSAESEISVETFVDQAGSDSTHATGWRWAAPGPDLRQWGFDQPLNVNGFSDGATCTVVWLPNVPARRVVIRLRDPERQFLDLSRLVIGEYFAPRYGAGYGSALTPTDLSTNTRTASGGLRTDWGPVVAGYTLDMQAIDAVDRHQVTRLLRAGIGRRHLVSAVADFDDASLVQDWTIYGSLRSVPQVPWVSPDLHQTQFQIEAW